MTPSLVTREGTQRLLTVLGSESSAGAEREEIVRRKHRRTKVKGMQTAPSALPTQIAALGLSSPEPAIVSGVAFKGRILLPLPTPMQDGFPRLPRRPNSEQLEGGEAENG
jgi:hypothetical protein